MFFTWIGVLIFGTKVYINLLGLMSQKRFGAIFFYHSFFLLRNDELCDYVAVFMLFTMDLVKNKCCKRNHNINILPHLIQCLHTIKSNT